MTFLNNTWYCAGWSETLKPDQVSNITIINKSLVLFRDDQGQPAALDNKCPHRFAPLDRGRVCNGAIECGYHGLIFDRTGACIRNPHGKGTIPAKAVVRAYPVVERHGAIWVWMGDNAADAALIPDFSAFDPDTNYAGRRYLHAPANYQLDSDNIMDLSHIQYLHGSTLGTKDVSTARLEVSSEGTTVYSRRFTTNEEFTPFLEKAFFVKQGTRVDRGLEVRWDAPASMELRAWATPTGRPASEGHMRIQAHIFTPETENTSHYFYAMSYPKSFGPEAARWALDGVNGLSAPFSTEDMPMLQAQQKVIGDHDLMELQPVMLESDAGAVRARRILSKLIKDEQEAGNLLKA